MIEILYHTVEAMTMPFTISLAVTDKEAGQALLKELAPFILKELQALEAKFSTFQNQSLVSRYRVGDETVMLDSQFQEVYVRSLAAKEETGGAFNPFYDGGYNPTGLVKGWAIEQVFTKYLKPILPLSYVEAVGLNGAGDMQLATWPLSEFSWKVGIEQATNPQQLTTRFQIRDGAIATSGYSKKGRHIKGRASLLEQVTVVATSLIQADIWATALMALSEDEARQRIIEHKLSGLYQTATEIIYFQHGGFQNA